jgi:L-arabinokinase
MTRTAALLERLVRLEDVRLCVTCACPRELWPLSLARLTVEWRSLACDAGVIERPDLSIDVAATRLACERWARSYDASVESESRWLRSAASLVLGDVPPLAFDAAALAGIPSIALANFSWDWIYAAMGIEKAAEQAGAAYRKAELLLELEPAAPMAAFRDRLHVGILGRRAARDRDSIRSGLGLASTDRFVLVALRATGPSRGWNLPEPTPGVRYAIPGDGQTRADVLAEIAGIAFIELLAAADCVVAKPGYGILADTAACGVRLLCTERRGFPEDTVLGAWMAGRQGMARLSAAEFARGDWLGALTALLDQDAPAPVSATGAAGALSRIRSLLAR